MELGKFRKKIDNIDSQILELLNQRAVIVKQVGKHKQAKNIPYFVPERERQILDKLEAQNTGPLNNEAVREVFIQVLSICRNLEKPMVIGYFGPETTFTHMAAYKTFGSTAKYLPLKTIRNVFEEVEKKRVDYGVVPIENSTEGVVNHTLDMFVDSNTKICAETFLGIAHYLLSRNTEIGEIKRVYSHQQPLAQCRNWLDSHIPGVELIETRSTAEAAFIATREHLSAAIASELAAKKYNLNVLAKNIEDLEENITRFLVIGQNITQPSGSDKTSVMLSIKDRVGALHDILLPFSKNKLNLTKIESRPSRKRVWEYVFFVDIEGHCDDSSVKKALKMLEKYCVFVKVLGSYPKV